MVKKYSSYFKNASHCPPGKLNTLDLSYERNATGKTWVRFLANFGLPIFSWAEIP